MNEGSGIGTCRCVERRQVKNMSAVNDYKDGGEVKVRGRA